MPLRGVVKQDAANINGSLAVPAGSIDGDYAVMWAVSDEGATSTVTWPTGFTEITSSPLRTQVLDAQTARLAVKILSGEPGTWTPSSTHSSKWGAVVLSDVDIAAALQKESGVTDTTTRSTPWTATSAAFSAATANPCDLLFFQFDDVGAANAVTHTAPGGFTLIAEHTGADFRNCGVSLKESAAAGEGGVYAGVGAAAGTSTNLAVFALAVKVLVAAFNPPPVRMAPQQRYG